MVVDPADGRELVRIARERGRVIHLGYPYPFTRHCRLLHRLIHDGELGEILFATGLFATSVLEFYRGMTAYAGEARGGRDVGARRRHLQ
jgi:predicted dehydrogenase